MDFLSTNEDVMEIIFSFMSLKELLKCSSICKSWYYQTNRNSLWKRVCIQEQIQPEEWNWDAVDDEWKLGAPCDWKKCLMNFKKTIYNWKRNDYRRFFLEGSKVHTVANDRSTSDTLLVENAAGLDMYKIRNCNIIFFQRLYLKDVHIHWVTFNNNYVIVRFDCGFIVFKLQNGNYKEDYFIYNELGAIKCTNEEVVIRTRHTFSAGKRCIFSQNPFYCLLGNVLYFQFDSYCFPAHHSNDARVIHVWNLQQRKYLLKINCGSNNNYDRYYAYISNSEGTAVSAYNSFCEVCFTVKLDGIIYKLNVNETRLIIFEGPKTYSPPPPKTYNVLFCNKHTGEKELPTQKLVVNEGYILFENFSDILFMVNHRQVIAHKIYNRSIIWQKPVPHFLYVLKMILPRENGLMIFLRERITSGLASTASVFLDP
uniref:F-box domain-containing protein n=1 Tax=Rhodnius prolixus TaxID=13249 RepID=T1HRX8_RHOPR